MPDSNSSRCPVTLEFTVRSRPPALSSTLAIGVIKPMMSARPLTKASKATTPLVFAAPWLAAITSQACELAAPPDDEAEQQ